MRRPNRVSFLWVAALAALFTCSAALGAERDWVDVGSLKAGGEAKTVNVGRQISKVTIACTSGTMILKSVTVVNDEGKYEFNVGNKLSKDQSQQVTVGKGLMCKSLLIAEEGTADYKVKVRD